MELKVFRDVLPAAGADCTAKAELPLETELLISDYLPPVQRIVKCFAKPVVLQKQLAPGRLTLEGYLRCTVYYQGEEGAGLCQTEQKLPFTKALELPSFAATAWTACVEGQTEYLNCRAVNPRRIEVRGAYGLVVSVHAQLSTEVITALSEGGIEQKPVTLAGVRRAATLEKLVTIEGALTFPKPPAAILDITGTAEVRELKRMQGKAVAKGVLHVLCGWRAEGDAALRSQTADLPFNQILDADGLSEDCRCLCVLEPVGFAAAEGETTEDGAASTTLTATAMLRLSGWRPYQLQCVADAFSTRFETTLTPQTLATESLLCALDETTVLRGSGPLPDAGAHILACFASFGPVSLTRQEGRAVLTARAVVSAFAENTLGEMECYEKALDYALPLPADLPERCRRLPRVLAERSGPAMRQRRRRAGCVPHRPGRGRGAGAADGLSRGGGGAGRPPRPRRPGGVAPHLLRPAGGGAVRHRPALPRLARPDAGRQRPPRRHRPPRRGAQTACAGGVSEVVNFLHSA